MIMIESYASRRVLCAFRIKYEMYILFKNATWIINLQNGSIYKKQVQISVDIFKRFVKKYSMLYDSCSDWTQRYLYFVSECKNGYDLMCFDRIIQDFFMIKTSYKDNGNDHETGEDRSVSTQECG